MYEWEAPSGIKVVSSVPRDEDKWWDNPWLHPIWSYASWTSMVLVEFGHYGMREFFAKRGWWSKPKRRAVKK